MKNLYFIVFILFVFNIVNLIQTQEIKKVEQCGKTEFIINERTKILDKIYYFNSAKYTRICFKTMLYSYMKDKCNDWFELQLQKPNNSFWSEKWFNANELTNKFDCLANTIGYIQKTKISIENQFDINDIENKDNEYYDWLINKNPDRLIRLDWLSTHYSSPLGWKRHCTDPQTKLCNLLNQIDRCYGALEVCSLETQSLPFNDNLFNIMAPNVILFLQNPFDRIHYYYSYYLLNFNLKLDFERFIQLIDQYNLKSIQIQTILGFTGRSVYNQNLEQKAIDRLNRIAFIGLHEFPKTSICLFYKMFSKLPQTIDFESINSPIPNYNFTNYYQNLTNDSQYLKIEQLINQIEFYDINIYNHAKSIFFQRLDEFQVGIVD
eukprot:TRINITY_DN2024_c0_g1_i1.p1 TRINITY_DN2024_c0_g1~~TRINITY_DN2024_c0_g1_i1.p1  ORF type:complete len:378 (+),score=108.88 TRINITY_DN2024_c0_g1_i1:57-1190(+)